MEELEIETEGHNHTADSISAGPKLFLTPETW